MSEFLAEAQVRIVPNTATFRAELEAQLRALTAKPVVVPVTAAVTGAGAAGAATVNRAVAESLGQQVAVQQAASCQYQGFGNRPERGNGCGAEIGSCGNSG